MPRRAVSHSRLLQLESRAARVAVAEPKRVAGAAGWTEDQYKMLFRPLLTGKEADWSMGDDAPPAFLSSCTARSGTTASSASRRSRILPSIRCAKPT